MNYFLTPEENKKRSIEKVKKSLSIVNLIVWITISAIFLNFVVLTIKLFNGGSYILNLISLFTAIIALLIILSSKKVIIEALKMLEDS